MSETTVSDQLRWVFAASDAKDVAACYIDATPVYAPV
jgi:hypothetical protein